MDMSDLNKIRNHPDYLTLVKQRGRYSWGLSLFAFMLLAGFIAGAVWAPGFYGRPLINAAGVFTVGMLAGLILILGCVALTWYYLHKCNTRFIELQNSVVEQFQDE